MSELVLTIQSGDTLYYPTVLNGVTWETERSGSPSKLTFTVLKDQNISFNEGDSVTFSYDGNRVFFGYVFTKKRTKEHHIEVTAYDQMRYLKNKYSYAFENKTATEIIKSVCQDFGVKTGELEDTGYVIKSMFEENQTLFDIFLDALDETLQNTGKLYILYDNGGTLELKELSNMATNVLIDEDTAQDFTYTSSIDKDTYNKIVLYYVNEQKEHIPYVAKDDYTIDKWGLLQYFEEVKSQSIAWDKSKTLLSLYNRKNKELKISNAFGNPSARAGSLVVVNLNLGDMVTSNYMLVEKATHKFEENNYTMELTMNGYWGD